MNQVLNVTKDEFDAAVRAKVEEALSDKEEIEARRVAEEALAEAKATFEQLKTSLEAKDAKIAEYEDILSNLETSPSAAEVAANEKIVALEKEVEQLKRRSEVAEAALETIAREETAANRMAELEEAGVALEDEAAEAQYSKVRSMSDSEFGSYKDELVTLVALKSKATASAEEETQEMETAKLSAEEISLIAQSLGCKPEESDCIALVEEVAAKMSEVSKSRKKKMMKKKMKDTDDDEDDEDDDDDDDKEMAKKKSKKKMPPEFLKNMKNGDDDKDDDKEKANKESASEKKLSLGESLSKALNQEVKVRSSLKEELAQAWDERLKSRKDEKK